MQIGRTAPPGRLRCQSRRGRQEPSIPTGAVNGLIEREFRVFIASDTFADVLVRVNTRAQQTLVRVLTVDRTGAASMLHAGPGSSRRASDLAGYAEELCALFDRATRVVLDRAAPLRPDGMTRQLPHEVDHVMVRSTPEYRGGSSCPTRDPRRSLRPPPRASHGWRSIAAAICVVLAALLTTPAGVAFWGQRTLNDGQRYLDTVGPLVDSPQVQDAISTKAIGAIEQQVDVEAILNDVFAGVITDRPRLQQLVGPLSGAVNGLIEREVRAFVASDAFADMWVRVNTRAQQALVRVLQGDNTARCPCRASRWCWTCPTSSTRSSSASSRAASRSFRTSRFPRQTSRSCCWTRRN